MPALKKCCCCCSLRTGGVILGWLGIISCLFNITSTSVMLGSLKEIINHNDAVYDAVEKSLPYVITAAVIGLLAYILLLVGASYGNRYFLLPWLSLGMVGIVIKGLFVISFPPLLIESDDRLIPIGVAILCVGLPLLGLEIYWWVCVLSLYQEIRQQEMSDRVTLVPPKHASVLLTDDYSPPPYAKLVEHI